MIDGAAGRRSKDEEEGEEYDRPDSKEENSEQDAAGIGAPRVERIVLAAVGAGRPPGRGGPGRRRAPRRHVGVERKARAAFAAFAVAFLPVAAVVEQAEAEREGHP